VSRDLVHVKACRQSRPEIKELPDTMAGQVRDNPDQEFTVQAARLGAARNQFRYLRGSRPVRFKIILPA
jgi:hypothetical protein